MPDPTQHAPTRHALNIDCAYPKFPHVAKRNGLQGCECQSTLLSSYLSGQMRFRDGCLNYTDRRSSLLRSTCALDSGWRRNQFPAGEGGAVITLSKTWDSTNTHSVITMLNFHHNFTGMGLRAVSHSMVHNFSANFSGKLGVASLLIQSVKSQLILTTPMLKHCVGVSDHRCMWIILQIYSNPFYWLLYKIILVHDICFTHNTPNASALD